MDVSTFSEDLMSTDFIPACEKMEQRLLCFKDQIICIEEDFTNLVHQAHINLTEKKVTINFVALCNTGKSTLLNAILGGSFLPMSALLETSVKVTINHDSNLHQMDCFPGCLDTPEKNCPILEVVYPGGTDAKVTETVQGVQDICERIRKENKKQRMGRPDSVPEFYIKVNIPFLAGKIPEGWTICLVDIPGFGEANKGIAQVAMESVQGSSGYVLVTAAGNSGQQKEAEIFELFERKGAFKSNSLIIALTKSEQFHSQKNHSSLPGETNFSTEDVKYSICRNVETATNLGGCVSPKDIVCVSGKWGLGSSSLGNCRLAEGHEEYQRRLDLARKYVGKMAEFTCGQGNKQHDLEQLSISEIVKTLDDDSGMNKLKERITSMVGTCRKIWADSLLSNYYTFSAACTAFYLQHGENIQFQLKEMEKTCETLSNELNAIQRKEDEIQATLNKEETSAVWIEMEEAYNTDTTDLKLTIF